MLVLLNKYQKIVNQIINIFLIETINDPLLKEMSLYALEGGKRLRSGLMLDTYLSAMNNIKIIRKDVVENNQVNIDEIKLENLSNQICQFIVCVELLHNASLVLDDLPSMDNDKYRRNRQSIHTKYGRSNANVLAAFFIEHSFHCINMSLEPDKIDDNLKPMNSFIVYFKKQFMKEMMVATEGQNLDLNVEQIPTKADDDYWEYYGNCNGINLNLIGMKTAPFFMIAFCGGYLVARIEHCVERSKYLKEDDIKTMMKRTQIRFDKFKEASYQYSYGFQISDDILDVDTDNKANIFSANYSLNVGLKQARKKMMSSLHNWKKIVSKMSLWTPLMEELFNYIPNRKK
jgi:geranylgeranyl pyrophosphate synthase